MEEIRSPKTPDAYHTAFLENVSVVELRFWNKIAIPKNDSSLTYEEKFNIFNGKNIYWRPNAQIKIAKQNKLTSNRKPYQNARRYKQAHPMIGQNSRLVQLSR